MAEGGEVEIFNQIQTLISDQLQVVSYKWLSRNFSVSSNHAKRLLHEFVAKNKNELEVVYAMSGWLNNTPQTYCIRLASSSNLAEVKKEFKDNCSVQVYSVQACIPKDAAVLWNAEFVQAEELFNQPSTTENCLRDNRFCGVSNSYVKRTVDGKSVSAVSPLKNKISVKPKASVLKDSSTKPPQGPVAQSSAKPSLTSIPKESTAVHTNKKKVQNEKTSSGNSGSLASLWGRASDKPKPSSPALGTTINVPNVPNVPISAEAQIGAHEAADVPSSDDDVSNFDHKRKSNGSSNRKRKVVIDFSDDEDENVVNLASPGPSHGHIHSESLDKRGGLTKEKKNPNFVQPKEDKSEVMQDKLEETDSVLSLKNEIGGEKKKNITGISLQKKPQNDSSKKHAETCLNNSGTDNLSTSTSVSPKRRKVLKTRTDERGREVTEVVWEDEAGNCNTDKITSSDVKSRPAVESKAPAAPTNALPNPASKPAASTNSSTNPANKPGNKKPGKGGAKDAKQGNILSFFKKI